ncbi:hypothetical protein D9M69_687280 [compost metagenome]
MAGMPSNTLPRMTKATMETAMKVAAPPGRPAMVAASWVEKPDCVSAQAMLVAVPMMRRMAPDRQAVSTSMGLSRLGSKQR